MSGPGPGATPGPGVSGGQRPSELWLVRHGETAWSRTGRHTGRTDVPLDDDGRAAARRLGRTLAGLEVALVATSPLSRASDTAELSGFGSEAGAVVDPALAEWDYGRYEGRTTAKIRDERPGWDIWCDGTPGGETAADVGARVDGFLGRMAAVEGRVLVFAHAHLLRVLAARWIGLPPAAGRHFTLDTATVSVLGWYREDRVVRSWNARPAGVEAA